MTRRLLLCLLLAALAAGCSSEHERNKNLKDAPDRPRITDSTAKPVEEKEKDKKPADKEKDKEKKPAVDKDKKEAGEKEKKPAAEKEKEKK